MGRLAVEVAALPPLNGQWLYSSPKIAARRFRQQRQPTNLPVHPRLSHASVGGIGRRVPSGTVCNCGSLHCQMLHCVRCFFPGVGCSVVRARHPSAPASRVMPAHGPSNTRRSSGGSAFPRTRPSPRRRKSVFPPPRRRPKRAFGCPRAHSLLPPVAAHRLYVSMAPTTRFPCLGPPDRPTPNLFAHPLVLSNWGTRCRRSRNTNTTFRLPPESKARRKTPTSPKPGPETELGVFGLAGVGIGDPSTK